MARSTSGATPKARKRKAGKKKLDVAQCGVDLLLNFWRQGTQISCPRMVATGARHGYDGDALREKPAAVVTALGTLYP
jgi:hypothetical protein